MKKVMAPNEPTYAQPRKLTTTIQMVHHTFQPVGKESNNYKYFSIPIY